MSAITVAYTSEKGGVGKTSSTTMHALLLALSLAPTGQKVLVMDMDPQAHTAKFLGHPRENHVGPTIKDAILNEDGSLTLKEIIVKTYIDPETAQVSSKASTGQEVRGPDLVPITLSANTLDFDMKSRFPYWPDRIAEILEPIRDQYAYILFDCPPGLMAPTMSTYAAVDFLTFPVTPDSLGMEGLQGAISAMQRTKRKNAKIRAAGAFFCKTHIWRADKDVMEAAAALIQQSNLDIPMMVTTIPEAKDFSEAIAYDGSLVVLSRPDSRCARAYWYVLDELLEQIGGPAQPLVKNAVLKMKEEDQQQEEERKLKKVSQTQKGS